MKTFIALLLGLIVGAFAVYVISDRNPDEPLEEMGREIADESRELKRDIKDGFEKIDGDKIKRELKDAGDAVVAETKDAAISVKIKSKLAANDALSALKIDVDTADGVVTLSGTVDSTSQIQKAIDLAESVEGVRKIYSTLQVVSEKG